MRPARVAFIGQRGVPATIGGIEHHVEEIGSRLVERGHEVTVYTRANYTVDRVAEHRGMRVRYIPTAPTKHLEALVHSGLSTGVAMLPSAHRADILHYHAIGPSIFTPFPRALTRRGVVLTIHGLDYERDKWGVGARTALKGAAWISAHVPHATITVSKSLADFYLTRYGRHAYYIPNGVAPPVRCAPRLITQRFGLQGGDYALFLGRLVPEKAPDLLVRAFRNVDTTARLVIAGGSSFTDHYVHELEVLAARDPRVLLVGSVHGELLHELYTNASMFVLPSRLEGLALTLLEAASYRLPLVTSDIAPNREVLEDDGPGRRMFASGDAAGLTAALTATFGSLTAACAAAGELGDRVVREYDWDAATSATEDVYEQVLHRSGAARDRLH
jgi:glycosyltransferase involved in cell wall biosynthesis